MAACGCGSYSAATAKHLRVLLPFTYDSLRIPDKIYAEIGAGEVLLVGPSARVWRVEVGRDGDGAFLGRGWQDFAEACGVGAGWFLVLRHRGRGVLTLKAFDDSCCLKELGAQSPAAAVETTTKTKGTPRRPQFINVFPTDSMGKMLIPARFVQQYIPKEHLTSHMAIVSGPIGKIRQIELQTNQLDMFFADGWSQFMAFHGITKDDALLLRYEGNMVFTVKVFGPDGYQRRSMHNDGRIQQNGLEITSALNDTEKQQETSSIRKGEIKNNWPSTDGQMRSKCSMTSLKKKRLKAACDHDIGPPAWLTKNMCTSFLRSHRLSIPRVFCNAIGLPKHCSITLQDSMDSARSWLVRVNTYKGSCQLGSGWKKVCEDIGLKDGDVLTFKVIKTALWDVIVKRS